MKPLTAGMALAAATVLLLTGCSSDDESGGAKTTAPDTVTVTESVTESTVSQSVTTTTAAPKFSAGLGSRGGSWANGSTWNFSMPTLSGGSGTPARTGFDEAIDAAADRLVDGAKESDLPVTIGNGELGDEKTRAVVNHPATLSGTLIVLTNTQGAAYPTTQVDAVVIDVQTGEALTLDDVLTEEAARTALAALAQTADTSGRLADASLDPAGFAQWIALPEGLHLYVPVAHVMGDYVPVTIPWNQVAPLLTPDARTLLAG